jgi:hypothetical protein
VVGDGRAAQRVRRTTRPEKLQVPQPADSDPVDDFLDYHFAFELILSTRDQPDFSVSLRVLVGAIG